MTPYNLKFYNDQTENINEAGDYNIYIGNASDANLKGSFKLTL